jgi:hypothetical protein
VAYLIDTHVLRFGSEPKSSHSSAAYPTKPEAGFLGKTVASILGKQPPDAR